MVERFDKDGYQELGRASLIEPTIGAKEERAVAWAHPAYVSSGVADEWH
jgi:hypothetical protein